MCTSIWLSFMYIFVIVVAAFCLQSEHRGHSDLHWIPAVLCQVCGSVDRVWLCSDKATLHRSSPASQRSTAAPPCSTSESEVPLTFPPMMGLSSMVTRGSSEGRWTSWQQKLAQHMKRSHCPEKDGEEGSGGEKIIMEKEGKHDNAWIWINFWSYVAALWCTQISSAGLLKEHESITIMIIVKLRISTSRSNSKHQCQSTAC